MRVERGEEIVATVLEAQGSGRRLSWRDQVDLVWGGLAMRRQRRPPLRVVLAYSLRLSVHPRWLPWVADDLDDPNHVRRRRAKIFIAFFVIGAVGSLLLGDPIFMAYMSGGAGVQLWRVPRDQERTRNRYGLVVGGLAPDRVWSEQQLARVLPNLRVGTVATAVGSTSVLGLTACLLAAGHPAPASAPSGLARSLEVTVHPASTVSLLWPTVAGAVIGACVWGVVAICSAASTASAVEAPPARRLSAVVSSVLALVVVLGCVPLAATLRWQWVSERYVEVAAVAMGMAALSTLMGVVAGLIGWRRVHPLGLWELLPSLGPRTRWVLVPVLPCASMPGAPGVVR